MSYQIAEVRFFAFDCVYFITTANEQQDTDMHGILNTKSGVAATFRRDNWAGASGVVNNTGVFSS